MTVSVKVCIGEYASGVYERVCHLTSEDQSDNTIPTADVLEGV